jgi:hypothetical protein
MSLFGVGIKPKTDDKGNELGLKEEGNDIKKSIKI